MWGTKPKIREKKAVETFMKWYITTQTPNGESTVREAVDYIKKHKSTLIYELNQKKMGWRLHESNNFIKTLKYSKKYHQELNHWRMKL
jgi:hypothetical protein